MRILIPFLVIIPFLTSCATLVTQSTYSVGVFSEPEGANVTVKKRNGTVVYTGYTPAQVKLKASSAFFVSAKYYATCEMEGYKSITAPIKFILDPWYIGNIPFGIPFGFLIIDPATGSMFKPKYTTIDTKLAPLK